MSEHHYTFHVKMSCGGCSGAVERVLKRLDGMHFPSLTLTLHLEMFPLSSFLLMPTQLSRSDLLHFSTADNPSTSSSILPENSHQVISMDNRTDHT